MQLTLLQGPLSILETDPKSLIGVTSPPCARESQSPLIDSLRHMEREGELEKEGMQGRQKNTTEDGYHRLTYLGVDRIHKTNEAVIPQGIPSFGTDGNEGVDECRKGVWFLLGRGKCGQENKEVSVSPSFEPT